jgi:hypothetical protein
MGLFTQDIKIGLSNNEYVVEKITLPPIKKKNIDLFVAPGTIAYINKQTFKGQGVPFKINDATLGANRGVELEAFLYPDKTFDNISISFFGGQHSVTLSSARSGLAKAKFSIVGNATIELSDYKDLASYFNRTVTKQDIVDEVNKNCRVHLTNEVCACASSYITDGTTEIDLQSKLNAIASDIMQSRKAASVFMQMGLMLSQRGVSMHINPLEEADEMFKVLNEALLRAEVEGFDKDRLDREERDREAQRRHEIDLIRAQNTVREESDQTRTINSNGNAGNVTINETPRPASSSAQGKKFCSECGAELKPGAKFCNECGTKA